MRRGLGLLRPTLSLQRSQGGKWGAVVRDGGGHFKPAEPLGLGEVVLELAVGRHRDDRHLVVDGREELAAHAAAAAQARAQDVRELGEAAGLKRPPPSLTTAPHLPPWLLWRLRVGLSNPKPRLISSEAEAASWNVAGRSAQNAPWPL